MRTFHPFPRLPTELRDQIWAATVEPVRDHNFNTTSIYADAIVVSAPLRFDALAW